MDLRHLTNTDLTRARDAAGYLLGLRARLDPVLQIKLDTFRADVTAAIEDRDPATPQRQP
jgi:hypothetical protein